MVIKSTAVVSVHISCCFVLVRGSLLALNLKRSRINTKPASLGLKPYSDSNAPRFMKCNYLYLVLLLTLCTFGVGHKTAPTDPGKKANNRPGEVTSCFARTFRWRNC